MLALSFEEDIGTGDLTSLATVASGLTGSASIVARDTGVVAGMALLEPLLAVLRERGRPEEQAATISVKSVCEDGAALDRGQLLCRFEGSSCGLLVLERTVLNYLSRLCGIATLTAAFVERVKAAGSTARVLDTRKTLPGHRALDRYAVRCGGGHNHRAGLFDAVLIKENHVAAAGGIVAAVAAARAGGAGCEVECECEDLAELGEALDAGVDAVLLDNFTPELVGDAVALVAGRCRVEVSGGVTLDSIAAFAATGADDISVGALTHSAPAFDLSMSIETRP